MSCQTCQKNRQTALSSVSFILLLCKKREEKSRENERSPGHWFHSALWYPHKVLRGSYYVILRRLKLCGWRYLEETKYDGDP